VTASCARKTPGHSRACGHQPAAYKGGTIIKPVPTIVYMDNHYMTLYRDSGNGPEKCLYRPRLTCGQSAKGCTNSIASTLIHSNPSSCLAAGHIDNMISSLSCQECLNATVTAVVLSCDIT
jgi:hypothetical protein